mmetsp:Transcript_49303/g.131917  ORF Transcript_49303/g.131917 Transcript_49303/m.131917 type:complete len:299 (+) Transcript_49303:176-1072(+)
MHAPGVHRLQGLVLAAALLHEPLGSFEEGDLVSAVVDHQEGVLHLFHVVVQARVHLREGACGGPAHAFVPAQSLLGEAGRTVANLHRGDLPLPGVAQVVHPSQVNLAAGADARGHLLCPAEWDHQVPQQELHGLRGQVRGQRGATEDRAAEPVLQVLVLLQAQPDVHPDHAAHARAHDEDGQLPEAAEHLVRHARTKLRTRWHGLGHPHERLREPLPVREDRIPVLDHGARTLAVAVAEDVQGKNRKPLGGKLGEEVRSPTPPVDVGVHAVAVQHDGLHALGLRVARRQHRSDVQAVS